MCCQVFWVCTNFCNNFILVKYLNMLDVWILVVLFLTPLCLVHWRVWCYKPTTTPKFGAELHCRYGKRRVSFKPGAWQPPTWMLTGTPADMGAILQMDAHRTRKSSKSSPASWGIFRLVIGILLILDMCSWIIDLLCLNLMQVKVLCLNFCIFPSSYCSNEVRNIRSVVTHDSDVLYPTLCFSLQSWFLCSCHL